MPSFMLLPPESPGPALSGGRARTGASAEKGTRAAILRFIVAYRNPFLKSNRNKSPLFCGGEPC